MLIEETGVAEADLPLEPFKAHLRMGSGFGTETVQEPVLASFCVPPLPRLRRARPRR